MVYWRILTQTSESTEGLLKCTVCWCTSCILMFTDCQCTDGILSLLTIAGWEKRVYRWWEVSLGLLANQDIKKFFENVVKVGKSGKYYFFFESIKRTQNEFTRVLLWKTSLNQSEQVSIKWPFIARSHQIKSERVTVALHRLDLKCRVPSALSLECRVSKMMPILKWYRVSKMMPILKWYRVSKMPSL